MKTNSQKLIEENRKPRVHIAYDVEVSGEQKTVELPFVMGVMADLSGHDAASLSQVTERRFVEIDESNFDVRMWGISAPLQLCMPNQIIGDGLLAADLQFRKMEDLLNKSRKNMSIHMFIKDKDIQYFVAAILGFSSAFLTNLLICRRLII